MRPIDDTADSRIVNTKSLPSEFLCEFLRRTGGIPAPINESNSSMDTDPFLTIPVAAEISGYSEKHFAALVSQSEIPSLLDGGRRLIRASALKVFCDTRCPAPPEGYVLISEGMRRVGYSHGHIRRLYLGGIVRYIKRLNESHHMVYIHLDDLVAHARGSQGDHAA
jgi:hypothetical protein